MLLTAALTVALCLVFGCVFLVLALRCAGLDSLPLWGERTLSLERGPAPAGERFTRAMGAKSVAWAAALLAVFYGASVIYCAAAKKGLSWQALYGVWRHWDAPHYLELAEKGYAAAGVDNGKHLFLVFFPLYPWLVRLLHGIIPSWELCGHLISSVCFIAGSRVFARLVTEEFGWPTARLSLLLLSAWPYAFFFGAVYTESLFFLLSVSAFYFIRKHRWLAAGLTGALAALARMQGLLLVLAGLAEYAVWARPLRQIRARDWRGLRRGVLRALPLALTLAGTGIYLYLNYAVEGDPFRFMVYDKEHWSQGFTPMPLCLKTILVRIGAARTEVVFATWIPDLVVFLACLPPTVWAARHMPVPWAVYLVLSMTLNYSISWPLSCGRYMACAFPLFVTAAAALRRRPGLAQAVTALSALSLGTMFLVYLSGGHVY